MNLNEYLQLACERANLQSDRALSVRLGRSHGVVSMMRVGKMWPDDATMLRIAEVAGVDPNRALIDLNEWRAKAPEVKAQYRELARALGRAVVIGLAWCGLLALDSNQAAQAAVSADLYARERLGNGRTLGPATVDIMENFWHLARRLKQSLLSLLAVCTFGRCIHAPHSRA